MCGYGHTGDEADIHKQRRGEADIHIHPDIHRHQSHHGGFQRRPEPDDGLQPDGVLHPDTHHDPGIPL